MNNPLVLNWTNQGDHFILVEKSHSVIETNNGFKHYCICTPVDIEMVDSKDIGFFDKLLGKDPNLKQLKKEYVLLIEPNCRQPIGKGTLSRHREILEYLEPVADENNPLFKQTPAFKYKMVYQSQLKVAKDTLNNLNTSLEDMKKLIKEISSDTLKNIFTKKLLEMKETIEKTETPKYKEKEKK